MRIAIAADHAGYELKEHLAKVVAGAGHAVTDLGTHSTDPVDYPDYAAAVAKAVLTGRVERGIVVCGSGAGAAVAANKVKGIRAAVAHDTYTAHQCVEHDDVNVLALGSRVIGPNLAEELALAFLDARFSGAERHARRVAKIAELESREPMRGPPEPVIRPFDDVDRPGDR
ncbi:MAG TPA: ribose 5-phosphate isomerase B [Acidimicrobiia bacterium]|nr:ribose 5-phosphate isomerase B [Acidimicrobiia bacterium]